MVIGPVSKEAGQGDTMKKLILPLLVLFLTSIGCIESNPQPSPEGDSTGHQNAGADDEIVAPKASSSVDEELMYASAPGEEEEIIVVGAAGAAMDAEAGRASGGEEPPNGEDGDGDDDADFGVNEDGSFVVVMPKIDPPKITLIFTFPYGGDVKVELEVPGGDLDDDRAPWVYSGEEEEPANGPPADYDGFEAGAGAFYGINAADLEDGTVEVVGGFLSVTPLAKVVVANIATGENVVVQATNTGEFVAVVGGVAGDTISMFAVNPDEKGQATSPVMLVVE